MPRSVSSFFRISSDFSVFLHFLEKNPLHHSGDEINFFFVRFFVFLFHSVMSGQVVMRSSLATRQTPLLVVNSPTTGTPRDKRQFREVAGGTAAECAAVCCCCPCTVLDLLVTVVYRVPAGICRKAWNRTRKRHRCAPKKGLLRRPSSPAESHTRGELEAELKRVTEGTKEENIATAAVAGAGGGGEGVPETGDFPEKEMWDRFYGTGFWRSPSQRES